MASKSSDVGDRRKLVEVAAVEKPVRDGELDLNEYPGFETVFTETREQLIRQPGRMDALDSKAGIIAGFDGLIITAAVGLMPALLTAPPNKGMWLAFVYRVPVVVLSSGLLVVLVSFVLAIRAYRVRTFLEIINPRKAYEQWLSRSVSQTRLQLLHNMIEASEQNEVSLNDKADSIKKSIWWLLAGVLIFFSAAVLYVIFNF